MSISIKQLYDGNDNPFQLSVCAGRNSLHNIVNWIYMMEDEHIVPYFSGSELIVTTGMQQAENPQWLLCTVKRLYEKRTAGLIVNTGKFIFTIPQDVLDFCNEHEFPLLTMPWEVRITEMTQTFCVRIINNKHESILHDQAIRDAILRHDNEAEYREILATYYSMDADFTVISIYLKYIGEPQDEATAPPISNLEYYLETQLRQLQKKMNAKKTRIGLVRHENFQLLIINHASDNMLPRIRDVIFDVYSGIMKTHAIFIGIGIKVMGLSELHKSYQRAITAMRMAIYQNKPFIQFEDMGFYKILFSVKDENILYSYADEILKPLDEYDAHQHNYMELLKCYIQCDRSLELTAKEMFLHRNTVNYRIQKMKKILNSPLKTVEDLFPYQVALAIRDMESKASRK